MYSILIVSYANWDSLIELPAVFKEAGCSVDLFCRKDSWVLHNEYYDKWIEAKSQKEDEYLAQLLELVQHGGKHYDWIIPGDDIILRILNDNIQDEALFYRLMPLSKIENRALLGSKAGFSNLCAKYDISTPRFLIYQQT
ncbi:MAG: hypothetical protein EBZ77_00690, partial [Chitinophagia bacterium]|nr:hypothetical protein [Chitinophagia bacterium]